jgi:hypothetical protein
MTNYGYKGEFKERGIVKSHNNIRLGEALPTGHKNAKLRGGELI